MPARNARKPLNQQAPAPTTVETLYEAVRRYLGTVLQRAEWIGRQLGHYLTLPPRPNAVRADGCCKALRSLLAPAVPEAGGFDPNVLAGYGIDPVTLGSMLDSHTLGDDFVTATSALWLLLDQLPADVWTSGKPPRKTLVEDWQKATEMLRGCLASIQAGLSDDFADVAALPAEIAFILKRGEFPKLADDEYAKLGAWVTAHADEVYHHLDPANLAKIPRLEEAKKRLRQIHEYNATLRQAAPGVGAGPVARAATEGKQPSAGPSRKRKRTREPKTEPTRPLTDKAAAVLELLRALPPKRAMKGPDILTTLDKKNPPMTFDQSTLTKRIIPELKPYGVRNRPGVGYYIDPSMRRNDATSTPS